jgi:hypothetical protein
LASYGVHDEHICLEILSAFDGEVLCWKCVFIVRALPSGHGGMGREPTFENFELKAETLQERT